MDLFFFLLILKFILVTSFEPFGEVLVIGMNFSILDIGEFFGDKILYTTTNNIHDKIT